MKRLLGRGMVGVMTLLAGVAGVAGVGLGRAALAQPPAMPPPSTPQQLYEHVMRGVVALERNGVPMAIGTVLAGDGRVLTALSGLSGGDGADVLYADGTIVHARLGRSDRSSDLALLVPVASEAARWTEGLSASGADPAGEELRAMVPAPSFAPSPGPAGPKRGVHLGPAVAAVRGQVDAHARDGAALLRWLDVDVKGPPVAGAPLLDPGGDVVGVLVRACKGAEASSEESSGAWGTPPATAARAACNPVILGAPVSAIRAFLSNAAPSAPWLGIRGEPELEGAVHGVRVVAVAPSSPAEKAALKPAVDVIVAVDGHPIDTPEKLSEIIGKHAPGETVKLLVYSTDQFHEVAVALRPAP